MSRNSQVATQELTMLLLEHGGEADYDGARWNGKDDTSVIIYNDGDDDSQNWVIVHNINLDEALLNETISVENLVDLLTKTTLFIQINS